MYIKELFLFNIVYTFKVKLMETAPAVDASTLGEITAAVSVAAAAVTNPLADPTFKDAYDVLYAQINQIVAFNKVNYMNVALIFRAVIETIDAVGASAAWDDTTYQNNCTSLVTYILNDLHTKGKISDTLYTQLVMGIPVMSYSMVALVHLAHRGELALQKLEEEVEEKVKACCVPKAPTKHARGRYSFKWRQ